MSDVILREASPEEDPHLSRILCNAFLPIWNHNWFHNLSAPLETLDTSPTSNVPLSTLQARHLALYRGLITQTRIAGGTVSVAESKPITGTGTSDGAQQKPVIAAVLLFLPPNKRPSLFQGYKAGLLSVAWGYGFRCIYRILGVFEANVERMFAQGLRQMAPEWKAEQCGFVQMVARNPEWNGERGAASELMKWRFGKLWDGEEGRSKDGRKAPVILDTTTMQGIRAYERIGFKIMGQCKVNAGTDSDGFRTSDLEARKAAEDVCIQWVMILQP